MRCQDCANYAKLYRSVARSRAWVESSIRLLQEEIAKERYTSPYVGDFMEQLFAAYFLELYTSKEDPELIQEQLIKRLTSLSRLPFQTVHRIVFLLAQREIAAHIYRPPPPESMTRDGVFLYLGPLTLYSPYPEVDLETVLRYELIRRAWRLDWSLCPGTVLGGVPTQLGAGDYYSLFSEDPTLGVFEAKNADDQLYCTILSSSREYNQRLIEQVSGLPQLLFLSDNDRQEKLLPEKRFWRITIPITEKRAVYLIGNGDKESAKNAFLQRVPGVPTEDLDFRAMFARLENLALHPPVEWARAYRNHDKRELVSPTFKLGLVKRAYPKDYLAADSISDVFSFRVRMQCHSTNRKTGRDEESPLHYWNRHRLFTNVLIEANKLRDKQALIDYVYDQTKRCGLFNAALSTYVYARFGGKNSRILDGFAGWGDRLLAAAAVGCSEYHGFDTNPKIPYADMLTALGETVQFPLDLYRVEILPYEKAQLKENYYDVALLSPPFFQYEIYTGTETSTALYKELKDWLEGFWKVSLEITLKALRKGGWLVLYIPAGKDETARGMHEMMHSVLENTTLDQGVLGYGYISNDAPIKLRQLFVYRKL